MPILAHSYDILMYSTVVESGHDKDIFDGLISKDRFYLYGLLFKTKFTGNKGFDNQTPFHTSKK